MFRWRRSLNTLLLVCVTGTSLCFLVTFYLGSSLKEGCDCGNSRGRGSRSRPERLQSDGAVLTNGGHGDGHRMAIIVPFRDRLEELMELAVWLKPFLKNQGVDHHIFAINQVDGLRFNRASLLNVGFLESIGDGSGGSNRGSFDYIALHDVDLLPTNPDVHYRYPEAGVMHLSAPHLHPRYHYPTFIGGVLLLTGDAFRRVNGLSNRYWGWGLEDDEFYARLKEAKLVIHRPGNLSTGTSTFKHMHDRRVRRRDDVRCYDQHVVTARRDRLTGLNNLHYTLLSRHEVSVDGAMLTVINVELLCERSDTPWCDCRKNVGNSPAAMRKALMRAVPREDVIMPKLNRSVHVNFDG